MDFYVAKDCSGLRFFKDCPDLVKFSSNGPVEWTGYPIDFGQFNNIKDYVETHYAVVAMDDYDPPVHLYIDDIVFKVL